MANYTGDFTQNDKVYTVYGVLLAPLTGELVAALVAGTDAPHAELAALSPARFERMEARR